MVRELRDLYFVYTDGMHREMIEKKQLAHEDLVYRYGKVDIQVKCVKQKDSITSELMLDTKSVRFADDVDDPMELSMAKPIHDDDGESTWCIMPHVDRVRRLFDLAAASVYRFRIWHTKLGCVDGMVLYLPCRDGMEKIEQIPLHEESKALVFWKGRLIPYAKLTQRLPFMVWEQKRGEQRMMQHERDMQARTVLILFLSGVTGVDTTKFNMTSDLEDMLMKFPRQQSTSGVENEFEWVEVWLEDECAAEGKRGKWVPATKELTKVKQPRHITATISQRQAQVSLHDNYREWVEHCSNDFDRAVELRGRVAMLIPVIPDADASISARFSKRSELIFSDEEPNPWFHSINDALEDKPQSSGGLLWRTEIARQLEEDASLDLVFFNTMRLGSQRQIIANDQHVYKIDMVKSSQHGQMKASCNIPGRTQHMLAKVVVFYAERLACQGRSDEQRTKFRGPTCRVLVQRQPPSITAASTLWTRAASKTKTLCSRERS